jgi:hypothetical protein
MKTGKGRERGFYAGVRLLVNNAKNMAPEELDSLLKILT